jgi:transcriptional regulator with XRE-family HTH domain
MTFAEKIRALREAKGLSEAKLAQVAGLPFGTLHNYVLGTRKPSFEAVLRLSRALGVTCQAFADCEDESGEMAAPARAGNDKLATPSTPPADDLEAVMKKPQVRRRKGK